MLVGDSAGGNLALVTIHRARAAGEPLPRCAVLLSPALDCTLTSPSMADYDGRDPMLQLSTLLVLRRCYVPSPHKYTDPEAALAIHHIARFVRMRTGWDDLGA